MKISKTTHNMARRRGVSLYMTSREDNGKVDVLEIGLWDAELEEGSDEFVASYRVTEDGLFWDGSCLGNSEEFPYWIANETELRNLLPGIAQEVKLSY